MYEKFKIPPYVQIFFIGFLFGFLVCYTLPGGRTENDTNTAGTISAIKEQQYGVNAEINNANNGIREADNSVKRVSDTVSGVRERLSESQRIVTENADRVNHISKIARECKDIAEKNRAIYKSVGEANKEH